MLALVRSKTALILGIAGALFWAVGNALAGLGFAIFNTYPDQTYNNLITAASWLLFVGAALALGATCCVIWSLFTSRQWSGIWETAIAVLSTLLFAIGILVSAVKAPGGSDPANVVAAVGLGGWAALLLATAAQRALVEQEDASASRQASLRLGAAGSLLVLAISTGLPNGSLQQSTLAVATAVLFALGFAGLVLVISIARARHLITSRSTPYVVIGLWVLVIDGLVRAIASGIVFGPTQTFHAIEIGLSIPQFVETIGFGVLAYAALSRLNEIAPPKPATPLVGTWPPSDPVTFGAVPPPPPGTMSSGPVAAPSAVPASWQPDPAGRHELRWWEGTGWSEHVLDGGRPSVDPLQ